MPDELSYEEKIRLLDTALEFISIADASDLEALDQMIARRRKALADAKDRTGGE